MIQELLPSLGFQAGGLGPLKGDEGIHRDTLEYIGIYIYRLGELKSKWNLLYDLGFSVWGLEG